MSRTEGAFGTHTLPNEVIGINRRGDVLTGGCLGHLLTLRVAAWTRQVANTARLPPLEIWRY